MPVLRGEGQAFKLSTQRSLTVFTLGGLKEVGEHVNELGGVAVSLSISYTKQKFIEKTC